MHSKEDFNRMCICLYDVLLQEYPILSTPEKDKILVFCSVLEFEELYNRRLGWFIDNRRALVVLERIDSLNEIQLKAFASA